MSARPRWQVKRTMCVIMHISYRHMSLKEPSVKRKTVAVIMLTSVAVLLLTAAAFTAYDLATYRQSLARGLRATAAGCLGTVLRQAHACTRSRPRDAHDGAGAAAAGARGVAGAP